MKAVEYFNNGYSCSESIIKWAIDENLVSEELLPAATSFSGGMGVGCLCGAIAGSQIVIGYLFGKNNKYNNEPLARQKAKEFIQNFMKTHGATCCRILTKGLEMGSAERKAHCSKMVDDCENLLKEFIKVEVN